MQYYITVICILILRLLPLHFLIFAISNRWNPLIAAFLFQNQSTSVKLRKKVSRRGGYGLMLKHIVIRGAYVLLVLLLSTFGLIGMASEPINFSYIAKIHFLRIFLFKLTAQFFSCKSRAPLVAKRQSRPFCGNSASHKLIRRFARPAGRTLGGPYGF